MNHAKKLISGLLSVVMLLVMATTAFAVDGNTTNTAGATGSTGSITIKNATVNESYSVYKVFDLTYSENGGNVAYSYTASGENDAFLTALQGENSPFTLTATQVSNKYSVTLKASKDASAISTWLKTNESLFANKQIGNSVKATDSTVTFSNLPYGYYYVTSTVGTVATIDSTTPNVNVVDKNQEPTWGNEDKDGDGGNQGKVIVTTEGNKTVDSANYGDTVNFSVAVNAVSYAKNADGKAKLVTYYHIKDTLSDGFDAATNIKVTVGDKELVKDTDYTLTQNGKNFTVDVPFGEKYGSNAVINVTYTATINNSAVLAGNGNLNTANFTYTTDDTYDPNKPSYDPTKPGEDNYPKKPENPTYDDSQKKTTTTYVYALGVKKVDEKGKALKGAQFAVSLGDTEIYAKATDTAGVYEYSASADGAVKQFQTDDKGILIIKGLAAGDYSVKEVVAPEGYNLLKDAISVKADIQATSNYTTTITTYKDAEGNVTSTQVENGTSEETTVSENVVPLVVVNRAGAELPSTGGMGTTLFYALGGVLVTGAAILLVVKKRMERSSQ